MALWCLQMCSMFEPLSFLFFLVFKVIHSDYLGKFVQTRNPVTRGGCGADGCQIPQSLYDQLCQSETGILPLPLQRT